MLKLNVSALLFAAALLIGGLGIALYAADEQTPPPTPPNPAASTPRDVLDPLIQKSQWSAQWVQDIEAYQVAFKGPDVYVRVNGDFVVVQSYLGRIPKTVVAGDLIRVLRKNYDLYEGKFGLDKDMDLWFEIATSKRLLDGDELNRQIACVADAAAHASELVKTETPPTTVKP